MSGWRRNLGQNRGEDCLLLGPHYAFQIMRPEKLYQEEMFYSCGRRRGSRGATYPYDCNIAVAATHKSMKSMNAPR